MSGIKKINEITLEDFHYWIGADVGMAVMNRLREKIKELEDYILEGWAVSEKSNVEMARCIGERKGLRFIMELQEELRDIEEKKREFYEQG